MARVARFLLSLRIPLVAAAITLATTNLAWADPPARVGRLSQISGTVSSHASGEDQWSAAVINEPVTSGNAFWTEPNSHAEIHVGSTALRMDGSTELDVTQLDDSGLQSQLMQGTVAINVPQIRDGETYVVATPRGTVTLLRGGRYNIQAGTDADPTRVTVLQGQAQVNSPGADLVVGAGESARITGTERTAYAIEQAAPTPLDNWDPPRAFRSPAPVTARYVSPETTGYEDLDTAGRWREEPSYGPVWYPQAVPVDWAPYRYGHWRWVAPWGWTWIDDAPWGFAPFHYGRWAYIGDSWGWVPGPVIVERPVYAPALVVFIGGARWHPDNWHDRDEAVGWFPLAPHEEYRPSYPASVNYIRNVNVTNVTNLTVNNVVNNVNVTDVRYSNRAHATVVSQAAFTGARPVAREAVAIPASTLAQAPLAGTAAPVAPQHGDLHRAAVNAAPGPVLPPAQRRDAGRFGVGAGNSQTTELPQAGTASRSQQGSGQAAGAAMTAPAVPQAGAKSSGELTRNAQLLPGPRGRAAINSSAPAQPLVGSTAQAGHPTGAPGPAIRPSGQGANGASADRGAIATSGMNAARPVPTNPAPEPPQSLTGALGPAIKPVGRAVDSGAANRAPTANPAMNAAAPGRANVAPAPPPSQNGAPGPAIKPVWRAANVAAADRAPISNPAMNAAAPGRTNVAPAPPQPQPVWRAPDAAAPNRAPISGPALNAAAPPRPDLAPAPSQPRPGAPGPAIAATPGRLPAIPSRSALPALPQSSGNPMVGQMGHAQPVRPPQQAAHSDTSPSSPAQPAAARPAAAPIPVSPHAVRQEAAAPRNPAPPMRAVAAPEPPRRAMPVQQAAAPRQTAPPPAAPVHNTVIRQPAPTVAPPQIAARPAPPPAPPQVAARPVPPPQQQQPARDQHRPPRSGEPGYVAPPR
jgi:hypothetical protein